METAYLKDCPLWNSQYNARFAYEHLLKAHVLNRNSLSSDFALRLGVEALTTALEALGYDVVKREQKQEAA